MAVNDPTQSVNVATHLPRMAELQPHRPAVMFPHSRDRSGRVAYTHLTFRQLHDESDRLASGLDHIGIRRGMRTVLMVTPSLDFFALTFALFKVGAVPVLIDPGMGVRNLGKCLEEARPEAFIGIPKAHLARRLLGWGRTTIRLTVTTGSRLAGGQFTLNDVRCRGLAPYSPAITAAEELAAILFTSGSTGVAKGAMYSHGIFATQVELLREVYGIQPGEIDLPTFPLFALFGPALGMTAVIPDMDPTRPASIDPAKVVEAIENFGITNLFGSPAVINRVGRYGEEQEIRLPTLRRVISAGAPVPATVIDRFTKMLDDAEVFTPYGATEALPVASIGSREILGDTRYETDRGAGVCVGQPVPRVRVEIIPIRDEAIPEWQDELALPMGQVGEITVRGPMVTTAYFGRDEATRLAKMRDPRNGEIVHRMGDIGYRDARGRIWFCGRKSHRVTTTRGTLFTIPTEAVFNTHPAVFRTALVGVDHGGTTYPVLCVEREPGVADPDDANLIRELRSIASRFPHTQAICTFLIHPAFPVDIRHNAKIFREKLAVWASKSLARSRWQPEPLAEIAPVPCFKFDS